MALRATPADADPCQSTHTYTHPSPTPTPTPTLQRQRHNQRLLPHMRDVIDGPGDSDDARADLGSPTGGSRRARTTGPGTARELRAMRNDAATASTSFLTPAQLLAQTRAPPHPQLHPNIHRETPSRARSRLSAPAPQYERVRVSHPAAYARASAGPSFSPPSPPARTAPAPTSELAHALARPIARSRTRIPTPASAPAAGSSASSTSEPRPVYTDAGTSAGFNYVIPTASSSSRAVPAPANLAAPHVLRIEPFEGADRYAQRAPRDGSSAHTPNAAPTSAATHTSTSFSSDPSPVSDARAAESAAAPEYANAPPWTALGYSYGSEYDYDYSATADTDARYAAGPSRAVMSCAGMSVREAGADAMKHDPDFPFRARARVGVAEPGPEQELEPNPALDTGVQARAEIHFGALGELDMRGGGGVFGVGAGEEREDEDVPYFISPSPPSASSSASPPPPLLAAPQSMVPMAGVPLPMVPTATRPGQGHEHERERERGGEQGISAGSGSGTEAELGLLGPGSVQDPELDFGPGPDLGPELDPAGRSVDVDADAEARIAEKGDADPLAGEEEDEEAEALAPRVRAVHASRGMRACMSVFRLDPFAAGTAAIEEEEMNAAVEDVFDAATGKRKRLPASDAEVEVVTADWDTDLDALLTVHPAEKRPRLVRASSSSPVPPTPLSAYARQSAHGNPEPPPRVFVHHLDARGVLRAGLPLPPALALALEESGSGGPTSTSMPMPMPAELALGLGLTTRSAGAEEASGEEEREFASLEPAQKQMGVRASPGPTYERACYDYDGYGFAPPASGYGYSMPQAPPVLAQDEEVGGEGGNGVRGYASAAPELATAPMSIWTRAASASATSASASAGTR